MRFYSGNAMIPHPWRENLIKQRDSAVRATPACAVRVNPALPCSAVHWEERAWQRLTTSRVLLDRRAEQMYTGSGCRSLSSADAKRAVKTSLKTWRVVFFSNNS